MMPLDGMFDVVWAAARVLFVCVAVCMTFREHVSCLPCPCYMSAVTDPGLNCDLPTDLELNVAWRGTQWLLTWVVGAIWYINPILGGGRLQNPPPSGFSCAIAKRLEKAGWNFLTFKGHSLPTFCEIFGTMAGQASWPSFRKVCNHAMATVHVGSVWNLQDYMRSSVPIKCASRNLYTGNRRSGQFRDLSILSLWGNIKILPVLLY